VQLLPQAATVIKFKKEVKRRKLKASVRESPDTLNFSTLETYEAQREKKRQSNENAHD
jgi:hypothetical protein